MPKFDLDELLNYLIVIAVVVGSVFAPVAKKLIAMFSPEPPELPKPPAQSRVKGSEAQHRTARPVPPIEPPPMPTARAARPEPPAVGQPRPIARRVALGGASATGAARQARSLASAPMTLEEMVEDHLGHLTSNVQREAEHTDRDVKRRFKQVETNVGSLREERDRPVARKTEAGAVTVSTSVRRLTRQGLRRAILLREILGPPVALRTPDETW